MSADRVITQILKNLNNHLWKDVVNKGFYGRSFRTMRDSREITEVYNGKDYVDMRTKDNLNALCFFDVNGDIDDEGQDCNIIFVVKPEEIHPGQYERPIDKVQRDAWFILKQKVPNVFTIERMVPGIRTFGDIDTEGLKFYSIYPFHSFSIQGKLKFNYH